MPWARNSPPSTKYRRRSTSWTCASTAKGIGLLRECRKSVKCVVIQPGAESEEIFQYLKENHIPYIEGCLLVGMRLYPRLNRA